MTTVAVSVPHLYAINIKVTYADGATVKMVLGINTFNHPGWMTDTQPENVRIDCSGFHLRFSNGICFINSNYHNIKIRIPHTVGVLLLVDMKAAIMRVQNGLVAANAIMADSNKSTSCKK